MFSSGSTRAVDPAAIVPGPDAPVVPRSTHFFRQYSRALV